MKAKQKNWRADVGFSSKKDGTGTEEPRHERRHSSRVRRGIERFKPFTPANKEPTRNNIHTGALESDCVIVTLYGQRVNDNGKRTAEGEKEGTPSSSSLRESARSLDDSGLELLPSPPPAPSSRRGKKRGRVKNDKKKKKEEEKKKKKTRQNKRQKMDKKKNDIGDIDDGEKDERPFACAVPGCGRAFKLKQALIIHLRRHAGIKRYHCTL